MRNPRPVATGMLVIGRNERMGLGSMTEDFCRGFHPEHLVIINRGRPAMYDPAPLCEKGGVYTDSAFSRWKIPEGVTQIVAFETFYFDSVVTEANKRGIKSVLFPMWEWTPPTQAAAVDRLVVLSGTDLHFYRDYPNKTVRMKWPRFTEMSSPYKDWPPRTFIHVAGNAKHNRDGTKQVLAAAEHLIGTEARLVVYSAFGAERLWPYNPDAPIEFRSSTPSRLELFADGDVLVQPRRLGGHSLPINEAAAVGMPVIALGHEDWSDYSHPLQLPWVSDGIERFGRVHAPMMRCDPDELGLLMKNLALGLIKRPAPKSIPSWDDFVAEWNRVI